jgi:hypothetical protein
MTRTAYRASQFLHAVLDRPAPGDADLLRTHLPASLHALFARLSPAEQAHALAVLRTLMRQGHSDPALLAAALVHDVGKTRAPLHLMDRVLVVLADRLIPPARRWSQGAPSGWRRPFVVTAQHAAWGEAMLIKAGATATLAELVGRHHDPLLVPSTPIDHLLAALQAADGSH